MSREAARFGEVRSVLARGSGERIFEAVCALWPRGDVPPEVIIYVQGVTHRWPSGVPCAVPEAWRDLIMRGEPCAGVAMCKTLRVEMHDVEGEWWQVWEDERVKHGLTGLELRTKPDVVHRKSLMPPASFWSSRLARGIHHVHLQELTCDRAGMVALGLAPCMSRLRALGFERCEMSLEAGQALLHTTPGSAVLEALVLRELVDGVRCMGDELGAAWVESGFMNHVKRLDLSGNALSGYTVERLCASRSTTRITHLDLSGNTHARDLLEALAASYWSSQLHELVYRAQDLEHDVLSVLLRTPHFTGLRALDLSHGTMDVDALDALCGSAVMHRLSALDVSYCGLGDLGAYTLASAAPFSCLERLGLAANGMTGEGLNVILAGVSEPRLRELDVRENHVTAHEVRAAKRASNSTGECHVMWSGDTSYRGRVWRAFVDHAATESLGAMHQIDELNELLKRARLSRSMAWRGGAQGAQSPQEMCLKMYPGEAPPMDSDVAWMATWPELRYLTHLDISGSMCGMDFISAVLGSSHVKRVQGLDVRRSQVGNDLVAWLEAWPGRDALRTLSISSQSPGRLRRLVRAAWFAQLERLTVECDSAFFEQARGILEDQGATHVELICVEPPAVEPLYDTMTR